MNNSIDIREIVAKDKLTLFEWASDKTVRFWSFNSEPITFSEHSDWFSKRINDDNCLIYIFEIASSPIGLVRLHRSKINVEISYLLDPNYRGKGYSVHTIKLALETSAEFCKDLDILASTKLENIASIKTLERAGFSFLKKEGSKQIYKHSE